MKVYVRGYDRIEPIVPTRPFMPVEDMGVEYSETPEWRMPDYMAEGHLRMLREMRVHVAEHYCDFVSEELSEGVVAIACESHPALRRQRDGQTP